MNDQLDDTISRHTGSESKSELDFPEVKYPVSSSRAGLESTGRVARYTKRVIDGYARMQKTSAVVCAITRNTAVVLPRTIHQVTKLLNAFEAAKVVVFENDSSDETPDILQAWEAADSRCGYLRAKYDDPVHQSIRCLKRAARMAYYRNTVRRYALANFSDYDWIIVLDTDLGVGFSMDGIANTLGHIGWDMVGSNGIIWEPFESHCDYPVQYDAWAYRFQGDWKPPVNTDVNRLRFARGDALNPVFSCFGGLAVYRMAAYHSASYNGSDCEHVPMHRMMRYNGFGRQFLNPSMICDYGSR